MGILSSWTSSSKQDAEADKRDEQIMKVAHGINLKDLLSGGSGKGK